MENVATHEDWKVCFASLAPGLLLFARQWVRSRADAEDVVQEAFVRLWRRNYPIDIGTGGSRRRRVSPSRAARQSIAPCFTQQSVPSHWISFGATAAVPDGHFANGSEGPMRRVRYQTHETLQWRNAATGASLRVCYPSEEIVLIPISGQ